MKSLSKTYRQKSFSLRCLPHRALVFWNMRTQKFIIITSCYSFQTHQEV